MMDIENYAKHIMEVIDHSIRNLSTVFDSRKKDMINEINLKYPELINSILANTKEYLQLLLHTFQNQADALLEQSNTTLDGNDNYWYYRRYEQYLLVCEIINNIINDKKN
jgi:hypothetical protein